MSKYEILSKMFPATEPESKTEALSRLADELAMLHVLQTSLLLNNPFYEVNHDEYARLGDLIETKKIEIEELRK